MDFKEKYCINKKKYLNLKNKLGGAAAAPASASRPAPESGESGSINPLSDENFNWDNFLVAIDVDQYMKTAILDDPNPLDRVNKLLKVNGYEFTDFSKKGAGAGAGQRVPGLPTYLLIGFSDRDQIKEANPRLFNNIDYFGPGAILGNYFHKHDDYANIPDSHYDFVIVDHGLHRFVVRDRGLNEDKPYYYMSPVERMMVISQLIRILKPKGTFIFPYYDHSDGLACKCIDDVNCCDIHEDLAISITDLQTLKALKLIPQERNGKPLPRDKLLDYFGYYFDRYTMEKVSFPLKRNPNDQHLEHKNKWKYYKVSAYLKMSR
jgi:hypothetical protein